MLHEYSLRNTGSDSSEHIHIVSKTRLQLQPTLFIFLMFLHCDQTVIWLTIPICLFLIYKLMMIKKWFGGSGKTYVVSGVLLPSKVTNLNIRRNKDFNFNPGDWVFINIPSISNFEWHPFTIS